MNERERERVDSGEVFADLPDAANASFGPFVASPRAGDFRLAPRLPSGATVGQSPHVHTARHRWPAQVQAHAGPAASFGAAPGDELTRPAEAAEALQYFDAVSRRPCIDTGTIRDPAIGETRQVARVDLPGWRLAVVERVATYLRAQALDTAGDPIAGSLFVTSANGGYDPFPDLDHPITGEPLDLRWALVGVRRDRPSFDGLPAANIAGEAIQIQPYWTDLRWGWGQPYTLGLQLEVPSGVESIRLVATVATSSSSRWRVCVGGRLGGFWISGGPRGSALRAATSRVGTG